MRSHLATGNLTFTSSEDETATTTRLSALIAGFGLSNPVFLRRPDEMVDTATRNPFPTAAQDRPNHLLTTFLARPPDPGEIAALAALPCPEPRQVIGRALYVDYVDGVATSRLTPDRLERALGQPGTARNWNTVKKLIAATT